MTARILLATLYHSLQRASGSIAKLAHKKHFESIKFMDYKDADIEGFLDEVNARIALMENPDDSDIEAVLQMELMNSIVLKEQISTYLKLPQEEHSSENF